MGINTFVNALNGAHKHLIETFVAFETTDDWNNYTTNEEYWFTLNMQSKKSALSKALPCHLAKW